MVLMSALMSIGWNNSANTKESEVGYMNNQNELLTKRDEKMVEVKEFYDKLSKAHYDAKMMERDYIESRFLKYGIKVGTTHVRYKATGEVGVIKLKNECSATQLGMKSNFFGRPYTSLADNLCYYGAEFYLLTKKGEISERLSKDRGYRHSGSIENFISYFEPIDLI